MVEPKTAIACRTDLEYKVTMDILKKEGHTTNFSGVSAPIRIYVCPKGYKDWVDDEHDDLQQTNNADEDIDDFTCDEDDDFEWNYVEAADIFHNQIISTRIKGGLICYVKE